MGNLKIINTGGIGYLTKVIDDETGVEITNIRDIEITIEPSELVIARLTIEEPLVEIGPKKDLKVIARKAKFKTQKIRGRMVKIAKK